MLLDENQNPDFPTETDYRVIAERHVKTITVLWSSSVENVIRTGQALIEAKNDLPHGDWHDFLHERLPFGVRTAQRLVQIAQHPQLLLPEVAEKLPASWGTIYEISRLNPRQLAEAVERGQINPDMTRADAARLVPKLEDRAENRPPVEEGPTPEERKAVSSMRALYKSEISFDQVLSSELTKPEEAVEWRAWLLDSAEEQGGAL